MKATILAVGSELLGTDRLDTNSLKLNEVLRRYGVELVLKTVVGDDEAQIAAELGHLASISDLVLVSGGLGPTRDDVTREAVCRLTGRRQAVDEELVAEIRDRFRRYGREMPAVNRKQAMIIDGATVFPNPEGIALAQLVEHAGAHLLLLPGVPIELEALSATALEPWLAARSDGGGIEEQELRIAGLPESVVEERIASAYEEFGRESITVLARPGEVRIRVRAGGGAEARRVRLEQMRARLRELVGEAIFDDNRGEELEEVVGRLLRDGGVTVATAESCTGGLVAERLTRVPGSSDYFVGAMVAYTNRLKSELLGVPPSLIERHGAVSKPVAEAMATGVRERLAASYGLAVTGIAGPGGGSPEKPVGTVDVALAGPAADEVEHRRLSLPGRRERVRWQSSQLLLEMLRLDLLRRRDRGEAEGSHAPFQAGVRSGG